MKQEQTRAIILFGALLAIGCARSRSNTLVEIPEGFRGWITVEYGRDDCAALAERDSALFLQIPANGYLCTSHPPEDGWATDRIFEADRNRSPVPMARAGDADSNEVSVRGWTNGNSTNFQHGEPTRHWWRFCVGTAAECEHDKVSLPPLAQNG